jgi:hypothetical protein
MLRRRTFALLVALAGLAFPAASLAQSAGDEQYVDPIPGHTGGGSNTTPTTPSTPSTPPSTPSTPSTPPTPSTPTAAGTTADPSTGPTAATANGQLPRTGFDVIVTVELGLAMLLVGLVSQRMLAIRERRDHR